jgi:hypothetical protein
MPGVTGLVRRFGRTGFAAVASIAWALPLLAWAGSVDLYPGAWPWVAFALGLVLLLTWMALVGWIRTVEVEPRPSRLDLAAMSAAERLWNSLLAICLLGLIGWLNAAATVDWRPLVTAWGSGRTAPRVFSVAIVLLLVALVIGARAAWLRADRAFRSRCAQRSPG